MTVEDEMEYYVVVYDMEGSDVRRIGPYTRISLAEKAESGVNVNLDHDKYYTGIEV